LAFTLVPIVSTINIISKDINKQVTTSVTCIFDGQKKTFDTACNTVGEALEEARIFLGKSDITEPSCDTPLSGEPITVLVERAKVVIIIDDGVESRWLSAYNDYKQILADLNIEIYPEDIIQISDPLQEATPIPKIIISRAKPVTILVDGKTIESRTQRKIVGEILAENNISLCFNDKTIPSIDTPLISNMTVEVIRVTEDIITETEEIPFNTIINTDPSLGIWESRIEQEGICGIKEKTFKVFYENGKERRRVLQGERNIISVCDKIVSKGAEIGGASWYNWVGGMTCAHRSLPFGTKLKVTNLQNGTSCEVVVADRGPYISGRIIDLSGQAFSRIASLSSGTCYVQIQIIE
jgi:uncharacterized protein YabE (DUF348 family)